MIASETRPLLQGARLTAWELAGPASTFRVAVDGAGPFLMARGEVDAVILGADRICANGDVVNKVGTYAHALGRAPRPASRSSWWRRSPLWTWTRPTGADVEIEDRGGAEVGSHRRLPAVNPAFDVTPHDLVTAIVTDRRVIRLDRGERV